MQQKAATHRTAPHTAPVATRRVAVQCRAQFRDDVNIKKKKKKQQQQKCPKTARKAGPKKTQFHLQITN